MFFFRNAGKKLPSDSASYPKTKTFPIRVHIVRLNCRNLQLFRFFLRDNNISATQAGVCTIGTGCKVDQFYIWVRYTLPIMETYNCNFLFICLTASCLSHFRFFCFYVCSNVPFPCSPTHSHFLLCVIQFALRPQMSDCCWTLRRLYRLLIYFFLRFSLPFLYDTKRRKILSPLSWGYEKGEMPFACKKYQRPLHWNFFLLIAWM